MSGYLQFRYRVQRLQIFSDIDGNYQLSVGKKDTVYVSIAGYEKQKICVSDYAVENGKLMIDVLLQSLK